MWLDARALIEQMRGVNGSAATAAERAYRDELLATVFEHWADRSSGGWWRALRVAFELGRLYELARELGGGKQLERLSEYARLIGSLGALR